MSSKLVFRADGNSEIGLGHLYRLIAIANMLSDRHDCIFVTRESSTQSVIPTKYNVHSIDTMGTDDEVFYIQEHFPANNHLLVIDGYDLQAAYQQKLKAAGYKIVFLDDMLGGEQYANVILNPSLGIKRKDYPGIASLGLGPQYAPIRPMFLEKSRQEGFPVIHGKPSRVFICLGGADALGFTEVFIEMLMKMEGVRCIDVVAGAGNTKLLDQKGKFSDLINFHFNLSEQEMIELMEACDLAITSASTIAYEVCSLRRPLMIGWYADNQERLYNGLVEQELAYGLGNLNVVSSEQLMDQIIQGLAEDYASQLEQQAKVFDGNNQQRIETLITPLLIQFTLRELSANDVHLLYEWVNDEAVREASIASGNIEFKDHEKWFNHKLASTKTHIFIAEIEGKPVGQIRFDREQGYFMIDYSIAKSHRGKGLGKMLISLGVQRLCGIHDNAKIKAVVKLSNTSSKRVFEKMGFVKLPEKEDDLVTYLRIS